MIDYNKPRTLAETYSLWSGMDNSPGAMTWPEWERHTGRTADELRASCPISEATAEAMFPGPADDDLSREQQGVVIAALDDAWGRAILAA